jgi:hypothetical protein
MRGCDHQSLGRGDRFGRRGFQQRRRQRLGIRIWLRFELGIWIRL